MHEESLAIETRLTRAQGPLFSELDGEIVLLDIATGRYFGLDEIGARVWDLLERPATVADLCDALRSEFDVNRETCETDVLGLVGKMVNAGLVDVVD